MTAVVLEATVEVLTVKLAVDAPGKDGDGCGHGGGRRWSWRRATLVLLAALALRVTVQVDAVGGVMLDGVQEMFERTTAGLKVSEKRFSRRLPRVAVMTAVVLEATVEVFHGEVSGGRSGKEP